MPASFSDVRMVGRLGTIRSATQQPATDGEPVAVDFDVVVDREPTEIVNRIRVDTISCMTTDPRVIAALDRVRPGEWVEIGGRLRRRFWRVESRLGSATEVDVRELRVIPAAG